MRRSLTSVVLAVLALSPFAAGVAQEPALPQPGDQVRVKSCAPVCEEIAGTCETMGEDTLVLRTRVEARLTTLPVASITKLEVHRGRKAWGWWKGALIGFGVGAAAGAAVGSGLDCEAFGTQAACTGLGAAVGAGSLALIGGVTGALIKTDRWEEIPLDQLRVTVVPQSDGRFALTVSVAF